MSNVKTLASYTQLNGSVAEACIRTRSLDEVLAFVVAWEDGRSPTTISECMPEGMRSSAPTAPPVFGEAFTMPAVYAIAA